MFRRLIDPGTYPTRIHLALLLIRLAAGAMMLTHGYGKIFRLFGDEPIRFADPFGFGVTASLALTVFAEFVCSLFLIVGFATRLAAVPLIITMAVIIFNIHIDDPFGDKELPLMYMIFYFVLIICGAGRYSIDAKLYGK